MATLFIFREDQLAFDEPEILSFLRSMNGVSDIREDDVEFSRFEAILRHGNDVAEVRLSPTIGCLTAEWSPAGLEFALRVRNFVPGPLRITDDSYSFDIALEGFTSAAELEEAMDRAAKED